MALERYHWYAFGEEGVVKLHTGTDLKQLAKAAGTVIFLSHPLLAKTALAKDGAPLGIVVVPIKSRAA